MKIFEIKTNPYLLPKIINSECKQPMDCCIQCKWRKVDEDFVPINYCGLLFINIIKRTGYVDYGEICNFTDKDFIEPENCPYILERSLLKLL